MPKAIHVRRTIHGASQFMPLRAIHYGHAQLNLLKTLRCIACPFGSGVVLYFACKRIVKLADYLLFKAGDVGLRDA